MDGPGGNKRIPKNNTIDRVPINLNGIGSIAGVRLAPTRLLDFPNNVGTIRQIHELETSVLLGYR